MGLDPERIGTTLARSAGVVEVHDLHVWEVDLRVSRRFPRTSSSTPSEDCHERAPRPVTRCSRIVRDRRTPRSRSSTRARAQPPLQIEVAAPRDTGSERAGIRTRNRSVVHGPSNSTCSGADSPHAGPSPAPRVPQ